MGWGQATGCDLYLRIRAPGSLQHFCATKVRILFTSFVPSWLAKKSILQGVTFVYPVFCCCSSTSMVI